MSGEMTSAHVVQGKNTKCVVVALQESMVLIIELLCWVVRK